MQIFEVPERLASGERTGRLIKMATYTSGPDEGPTLVLIHGSPVASSAMRGLKRELEKALPDWRILVPDMPGLGASTSEVTDYSVAAHGYAVLDLLDALDVEEAHLLGYSMGGGVILEVSRIAPDRIDSLIMASAIGVQAYELFGSYELNHSVHWMQWAALKGIDLLVPHFGFFEKQPLDLGYARNFLYTDQRPLSEALKSYVGPMLIHHGRADNLIPIQAAKEHARLVPQAELELFDGGHLDVISNPMRYVALFADFVARAEAGEATLRAEASAERINAADQPFVRDRSWHYEGLALFIVISLLMAATMVSEDLTCIGGGLLAANGLISLPAAVIACFLGIFIGDLLLYTAGRSLGRSALSRRPMRWFVRPEAEKRAEAWFARRGAVIILVSRVLPGTRAATYFTAGVLKAPLGRFLLFFGVAAAIWTPLLVGGASLIGEQMLRVYASYEAYALPLLLATGLCLYLIIGYGIPALSWGGRRLLLGKWRRCTRWEYWPLWLVNAPVFIYVLWLVLIRYRKPMIFTLSNPGMPHGGFIGESKGDILASMPTFASHVIPWDRCPVGEPLDERMERLRAIQSKGQPWPIVIKPDEGQRGLGVRIVKSEEEAKETLGHLDESLVLQEFVDGPEYGVFYYRYPEAEKGVISSITIKQLTSVTGDGERSLEDLILADDRTVDRATYFLDQMSDALLEVPKLGERVPLVELGTHSRGATFLDGAHLLTDELLEAVEKISRSYEGFYYGRFDFKAPSEVALRAGQGLKMIELNGLTSEPTHIYAPGASLFTGWKTLMIHWHIAIRIGMQNERAGMKPSAVKDFIHWWWLSYHRQKNKG
jgi:membrane protein DedA with SNARE-associated domain/pimeloyl-ACP methyl ester carboxylesterase|tara:strand:+ start:62239 stop:64728 length:2490 start_codon:yes stop_codon:yes gene_type:complete